MSTFSFFGCWNQGYCRNNPFKYVSEDIKNNDTDFVIVAGDNYYPKKSGKKSSKIKVFEEDSFHSGFKCLLDIDKETYILMGNHDLQYEKKLMNESLKPIHKCHVTKKQMEYKSSPLIFDQQFYVNDDMLILFLNTSLYTSDKYKMLDCFKQYRYPHASTIDDIIELERQSLIDIVNQHQDNKKIVLVGHHPIVSIRENKPKDYLSRVGLDLFEELYSIQNDKNKYYLCADVHQYQKGTIHLGNHSITQYVVGTGGTKLDDLKCHKLGSTIIRKHNLSYEMEECDNKNFGYLIYDGDDFSFIKVKTNIDMDFNPYTKHVPIKFLTKLKTSKLKIIKLGKTTKRGTSKQTRGTSKRSRSRGTTKKSRSRMTTKKSRSRGTTKKSRSRMTTKQTRGTTKKSLLISSKEVSLD